MTTDPAAPPAFYGAVAGRAAQPWDSDTMPYTLWMNGDAPIGGIMELPEEARELGATVLMGPMNLPEVGTITVLADPHGAFYADVFGWQKDHAMDMGEMGTYQNKPDTLPIACWMPYIRVADVAVAAAIHATAAQDA